MTMILNAFLSLRIPSLDDRAYPPGGVAEEAGDFLWRFALLHQPENVPMGPLHGIFTLTIAFMKLLRFCFPLDFDSLSHLSSIHSSGGFHIIQVGHYKLLLDIG